MQLSWPSEANWLRVTGSLHRLASHLRQPDRVPVVNETLEAVETGDVAHKPLPSLLKARSLQKIPGLTRGTVIHRASPVRGRPVTFAFALLAIVVGIAQESPKDEEPLPPGAVARFGSA